MADDKDLLSRADSLIKPEAGTTLGERRKNPRPSRRRRSFLAAAVSDTPDGPTRFTRRSGEEDDLPLLTEVVVAEQPAPEESIDSIAAKLRPALAASLAELLDRHLAAELPALIEASLRDATSNLRSDIATTINIAVRDFVMQRGQLQLPLEAPDSSQAEAAEKQ
ncbi:hypothetical protein [Accumulibacter sp.]|uniref:hypothetical protein n=1 Tax=Accumulibacter sp. TaxID=2053492 RepID=UPI002618E220|nr:hypothetical protein [Accumulibacter sp.]